MNFKISIALLTVSVLLFATACSATSELENKKGRKVSSRFIGKKMSAFEIHSGFPLSSKTLADGGRLYFWRSDWSGFSGSSRDSGYGERCDLLIRTDVDSYIREIKVLEEGLACIWALQ